MSKMEMGRVQLRIMRVLWKLGRATARDVTDELNAEDSAQNAVAHSTVQTLLRQLEDKGSVSHDVEERTFVFYALVEEERVTRSATRDLIERVFAGDTAGLVAWLLTEEKIPRRELNALRKLIDERTSK